MLGVEVMAVAALGPWSQPAPLVGPDVGGQAFREAPSLDRPKDLLLCGQLLWASCLHTPPLSPLPLHTPALQALLGLQPHPQTKWLYLVSLGRQSLSGVLHRGRNWGR